MSPAGAALDRALASLTAAAVGAILAWLTSEPYRLIVEVAR